MMAVTGSLTTSSIFKALAQVRMILANGFDFREKSNRFVAIT